MRGEYRYMTSRGVPLMELPPRARRIPIITTTATPSQGTTSACAENTHDGDKLPILGGNYLRVRGEYIKKQFKSFYDLELPPRARRILHHWGEDRYIHGTTSACAENTPGLTRGFPLFWNYLRVRGEYSTARQITTDPQELPPRARRIR